MILKYMFVNIINVILNHIFFSFTCLSFIMSNYFDSFHVLAFIVCIYFVALHHKFTKLNVTVMSGITSGCSPEHVINQILLTRHRAST